MVFIKIDSVEFTPAIGLMHISMDTIIHPVKLWIILKETPKSKYRHTYAALICKAAICVRKKNEIMR